MKVGGRGPVMLFHVLFSLVLSFWLRSFLLFLSCKAF